MVLEHLVHLFPNFLLLLHDSDPNYDANLWIKLNENSEIDANDLHFQDVFEIFDIIPHMKFCENQYPIPVLNHLNYPLSWAAFCVLTVDLEEEKIHKKFAQITLAEVFLNKTIKNELRCHDLAS
mgnify:CR=1 FL=1